MQTFKLLTMSLLIGATLQAWDGPLDYLYYGLTGGLAKLPSQTEEARRNYKTPKQRADAEYDRSTKKHNDEIATIENKIAADAKARNDRLLANEQKSDVLSLVEQESLTPAQIVFLAKQAKIKNTQMPSWYNNLIPSDGKTIGYGTSTEFLEAGHLAEADIAKQLSGTISAEDTSKKSEINGQYSNSFTSEVKVVTAKLNTKSFRDIKTERVNGIFFCAVEYDARELSDKIIGLGSKLTRTDTPNYLNYSKFGMMLNKELGFDPKMDLMFNNSWAHLLVGGEKFVISDYEMEQFFSRTSTGTVISSLSKDHYRYGERVDLDINSNKHGYVSVIWVTSDGITGVLRENEEIYNSLLVTENKNSPVPLRPGIPKYKELLVTIFSENPIDLSEFRFAKVVQEGLITDMLVRKNAQHKFHKLIKVMKQYESCTSVVNTRDMGYNFTNHGKQISFDETGIVYAD